MPWGSERKVRAALAAGLWLRSATASADSVGVDTSYGRIVGDVALAAGAGVAIAPRSPRAAAEVRLRYLETGGWFATYEDASLLGMRSAPQRLFATGLELRPVFLARWLKGYETEEAMLDLTLDSIGFELGAVFSEAEGGALSSRPGLQVGLGVELPLSGLATGAWVGLHGGLRWSSESLGSGVVRGAEDRAAYLAITLAWHQVFRTHLVDSGDRAPL